MIHFKNRKISLVNILTKKEHISDYENTFIYKLLLFYNERARFLYFLHYIRPKD